MKRDFLNLYVNGKLHEVANEHAFWTLSDFLRLELGLVGTKIVCAEGDCGACSVLVGRIDGAGKELIYRSIDSCIAFLYQLDCSHIVTVEGLSTPEAGSHSLSPVQQAMVDCHGSQCGFCTPGFVTTLHGLVEESCTDAAALDESDVRVGLSGNLCRCTGYVQIAEAAAALRVDQIARLNKLYPPEAMLESFNQRRGESVAIRCGSDGERRTIMVPRDWQSALKLKAESPEARPVSGATDIGVQHNHGRTPDSVLLCLSEIDEAKDIATDGNRVTIGAAATWSAITSELAQTFPMFADVLLRFGSPQIRNMGTLGGNLANASPIADCIPFLYAMEAEVILACADGVRSVPIDQFYLDYKTLDLKPSELIHSVRLPLLRSDEWLKLNKTSKRRDMDISTFGAAIRLGFAGEEICSATIAMGGVGPTVLRLRETEDRLVGKAFSLETMQEAGRVARDEIKPISDVRGSDQFRRQLAENLFSKWFHERTEDLTEAVS